MQTIDERPRIRRVIKFSRAQEEKRQLICSAIRQLRPIEFLYLGGYRTVEPFALGIVLTDHQDNESLLCFQTSGFSDLLEVVGWKLYRVSDMQDLEVLPRNFFPDRPGYDPQNLEMVKIIYCVKLVPQPEEEVKTPPPQAIKIETSPIPPYEPPPPPPEVKPQPVIRYITHNELMERFRYAHPIPIPELYTALWPEPLAVPFPERVELKIWPTTPILGSTHYLLGQTA